MNWSLAAVSAILVVILAHVQGRSIALNDDIDDSDGSGPLWEPSDGRSRGEWLKYHGQTEEEMERVRVKLAQLKMNQIVDAPAYDLTSMNHSELLKEDILDECIWLTEEQLDEMLEGQQKSKSIGNIEEAPEASPDHHRQKRKIQNFEKYLRRKWTAMPIRYKFDGKHSASEMKIIRNAFAHWMAQTCVVFQEIPMDADFDANHILVTKEGTGCHSYVGKVSIIPQQLNLQGSCLWEFGIPVHEIGHSLGLWHEQQRADRDDHIKVNWDNLGSYVGQFYKHTSSVDLGVPYDLGSVMHYSPKAGSKNNKYTMESLDSEYQHNMGQRTGLSFLDAKIINTAYCSTKCDSNALRRPCEREGYQNPNDCSRCICPDGFSGRYCDELEPAHDAQCGGELYATTSPQTIKTPGFDNPRYYDNFIQCNWHIKAPRGHDIVFKFEEDDFGVYCHSHDRCYHWAELRYKDNLGQQGPRFCCYTAPETTFRGELGEMMLVFKSNFSVPWTTSRRGFKASFYAEANGSVGDQKTTTTTNPTTTTTKATTTTTKATTTTTKATTTTTMATTTESTEDECEKMDLAFVLDSSGSIMRDNWQYMLNFVAKVISRLNVGKDGVRVGITSYGNSATLHFDLDDFDSLESMILSIYTIPWKDQWTNTAAGLRVTRTGIFATSGDRRSAKNKAIMVTDGEANREAEKTMAEAEAARNSGIEIYVVGIEDDFNFKEANEITGNKDKVIKVDRFRDLTLEDTIQRIKATLCGSKPISGPERFEWSCSFEDERNKQTWCGITQNTDDDFNWTIQKGSTLSSNTGPSRAFDGYYYVFIEASNPRKENDNAVLTLPDLDVEGTHCINFKYHMYGFHINTLQLLKKSQEGTTVLWQRSKQQEKRWLSAAVEIELNERDQLSFKGIRGGEYSGDIALDMINIHAGSCMSLSDDFPSSDEVTTSSPGGAGSLATWLGAYVITFAVVLRNVMP